MPHTRLPRSPEAYCLPQPPQPAINASSFCLYSVPCSAPDLWAMQQMIYRMAFEQAQAVARPSLLERDLLAVWN